jgi:hypothetical protein
MATTQMPAQMPANGRTAAMPAAGLPPEQLFTWLEWVQDDLRRVDAQLQTLESARSQLKEQERLLQELLHASGAITAR